MSKVSMCKTEKLHSTFLEHKNIHTCKCCLNESWSIYRFVPRVVHHTTKIVKCRLDFFNLLVLFKRYAPHIIRLSGLIFVIFYEIQPIVKYKDSKVLIKRKAHEHVEFIQLLLNTNKPLSIFTLILITVYRKRTHIDKMH